MYQTLVTVNLQKCHLGVGAGKAIGEALKNHPSLTTLILAGNELGEHGVKKLAAGLAFNNVLTHLDLTRSHFPSCLCSYTFSNNIGGRGAKYVALLLQNPKSALKDLNLFGNFIGIEGARLQKFYYVSFFLLN